MTTADTSAQAGTGLDAAANAFEAILAGKSDNQAPPKENEADAPTDEVEALADADVDETAAADEDAEDATEDEAADEEEEDDEAEDEAPKLVTVKIDGKTAEVPLDEVVAGYQRQADYSRKTAALAEERKQLVQEYAEVQTERQYYAQALTSLQQQLATQAEQQPDWDRLYAEDPIEWVRQREVYRARQEKAAAAQIEMERLANQQTAEQRQALSQQLQTERGRLLEKVPTWKDDKVWERDRNALREYGRSFGFSDEELSRAYDHRAVAALYKAMKYDQLLAAQKSTRPDPARAIQQPSRGSAAISPRPVTEQTRAKQRLAKTGRVADAAKVFEGLI
jgi:hypothetical protein